MESLKRLIYHRGMLTNLLIVASLYSTAIQAAPICAPTRGLLQDPSEVSNFVLKAATIGNPDRMTAKDFARSTNERERDVEARYAASGDLLCGTRFGQAQVVLKGNILLTTAHILYEGDDCEKPRDLSTCKFTIQENGKPKEYEIEKKFSEGYLCPDSKMNTMGRDWAILKLKSPVDKSIKPYPIGKAPCADSINPAKCGECRQIE